MTAPTPVAVSVSLDVPTLSSFQGQTYDVGAKLWKLESLIPSTGPLKDAADALHTALASLGTNAETLFTQPVNTLVPPPPSGGTGKGRP